MKWVSLQQMVVVLILTSCVRWKASNPKFKLKIAGWDFKKHKQIQSETKQSK